VKARTFWLRWENRREVVVVRFYLSGFYWENLRSLWLFIRNVYYSLAMGKGMGLFTLAYSNNNWKQSMQPINDKMKFELIEI
jgi:hypothetical protein